MPVDALCGHACARCELMAPGKRAVSMVCNTKHSRYCMRASEICVCSGNPAGVTRFTNSLELLVAKLSSIAFALVNFFVIGLAYAEEIRDAPIPEPNYVGIIVFLGLFFGIGIWFMWKVMRNKGDGKK